MPAQSVIKHRRDTAANWTTANPQLAAGELGFETDTLKFKIGNGSSLWAALPYQSAQGIQGIQGLQGLQGPQGTQGTTGTQGATGAQGTQGVQGFGFAQAQGTTGAQGATGAQGSTGTTGSTGIQGSTGAQGVAGTAAAQGAQGTQGVQGFGFAQAQGIQGIQGGQGSQGIQGGLGIATQGATGAQGTTGSGAQGATGAQGAAGVGAQGTQGIQGATGAGAQGATGAQGAAGSIGLTGAQGPLGPQGTTGATGATGVVSASAPLVLSAGTLSFTDTAYAKLNASQSFAGVTRFNNGASTGVIIDANEIGTASTYTFSINATSGNSTNIGASTSYQAKVSSSSAGFWYNGTAILGTNSSGNVFAANVYTNVLTTSYRSVYVTSSTAPDSLGYVASSRRFKKNIEPLGYTAEQVLSVAPVQYHYNEEADTAPKHAGFIAEDVHDAGLHGFVSYDAENLPETVNYEFYVSALQLVVRKQAEQISALEARITALESK